MKLRAIVLALCARIWFTSAAALPQHLPSPHHLPSKLRSESSDSPFISSVPHADYAPSIVHSFLHRHDPPEGGHGNLAIIVIVSIVTCCLCSCCFLVLCFCCALAGAHAFTLQAMKEDYYRECPQNLRHKFESEEFTQNAHDIFKAADQNQDGLLSPEELGTCLEQQSMDKCMVGMFLQAFDRDGSGSIDEKEFIEVYRCVTWMNHKRKMAESSSAPTYQDGAEDQNSLARQLAETDCKVLRTCPPDEKKSLKRKLLAKWHPDKNVGDPELAKAVMQELQNRPEWKE